MRACRPSLRANPGPSFKPLRALTSYAGSLPRMWQRRSRSLRPVRLMMRNRRTNTKALIWFGRNKANQSHLSSKVYLIAVRGNKLYVKWGAADLAGRKVRPRYLQSRSWRYASHAEASQALEATVEHKLSKGYERAPRGIAAGLTAL